MPSTLLHLSVAGLLGAALLREHFDARSILIVMGVTAAIELDTIVDIWIPGAHRAYLHTLVWPLAGLALLWWDVRRREESTVRRRWGDRGVRVAGVSLVALIFAHVLLDAFFNGVNLFWPLHDQFYDLSGQLLITDQRGIVQTFVELERDAGGGVNVGDGTARGTVEDAHYHTGVNPSPDDDPDAERIFPIATNGDRFALTITGFGVVGYRLLEERRSE